MTNGEVIRTMDNETLAKFLRAVQRCTLGAQLAGKGIDSEETLRQWLTAEYEEEQE